MQKKILLYGIGKTGRYIYEELKKDDQFAVKLIVDNYCEMESYDGVHVVRENDIKDYLSDINIDAVIIAILNRLEAQSVALAIKPLLDSKIYTVHPQIQSAALNVSNDGVLGWAIFELFDNKPLLPYMEFQVADSCNLNCNACMHFSNISDKNKYADLNEYKKMLGLLKNKFSSIVTIRLMGGEPLLNEDLYKFVDVTKDVFPSSDIRITTNGLLIKQIDETLIKSMRRQNVRFDISQYKPIEKNVKSICEFLDYYQIAYTISPPIGEFKIRLNDGKNTDYINVFHNYCLSGSCTFLRNNMLYVCPHIPMLYENRNFFGFDISEDEYKKNGIDLTDDTINGWIILEKLGNPWTMCRYCSDHPVSIEWNTNRPQKEDWIS